MILSLSKKGLVVALLLLSLTALATAYQKTVTSTLEPHPIALEQLPKFLPGWEGKDGTSLTDDVRDILQLDKFVKRAYTNSQQQSILLYIGYWTKQSGEHQAAKHSPSICLPANGWNITRQPKEYILFDDTSIEPLHVKRLIGGVRDKQSLFTYWFFTGEHTYNEEWSALTRISIEAAIYGRSDGGIVEISAPIIHDKTTSFEQALKEAKLRSDNFIKALYPELKSLITNNPSLKND